MSRRKSIGEWGRQCKVQMVNLDKSLDDVCNETGLSRTYVSMITNGRYRAPDETINKISKALGVNPALYE